MKTALAKGWAKTKAEPLPRGVQVACNMRRMRQKRTERGLNQNGSKRKTMRWPELKGLMGKEYHKMYRRLERLMK
jgi:hypothetical protein